MNRSLLRTYALAVCILTGFSVMLIAAIPLWNSLVHSAEAIEHNDVYQFLQQGCEHCQDTKLVSAAPASIEPYQVTSAADESLEENWLTQWAPPWVFTVLRIVIGLVGLVIFAVHWKLYRSLGFAH